MWQLFSRYHCHIHVCKGSSQFVYDMFELHCSTEKPIFNLLTSILRYQRIVSFHKVLSLTQLFSLCMMLLNSVAPTPPLRKITNLKGFIVILVRIPCKSQGYQASIQCGGPLSACHRNAILMVFRWKTDYCLLMVVFGASHP